MKYQRFIFDSYDFDVSSKVLRLNYGYDDALKFTETYRFDFEFAEYGAEALDRAVQLLFFIAGVSYFKTYLAPKIVIKAGQIDKNLADFLSQTYQKGLGEFFYVNGLDPRTEINFPVTIDTMLNKLSIGGEGALVGIGGGKDSLVSVELMRDKTDATTWSVGHKSQLEPLIERIGLPHLWIERQWDKQLIELNNDPEAFNGHVPISAILAATGVVTAILSGKRDVVVSNEASASEPTLIYDGLDINHQYSKSLEFERGFKHQLELAFNGSPRYYSLLRPFSELRISEIFAQVGFDKYRDVFTSCNRAFTAGKSSISWCGECAKCAFVFLVLTPFVDRQELEKLYGKNMLLDPSLQQTYRQLLGIDGDKPLDCVGEIKESRTAMDMAKQVYTSGELDHYIYEIPEDYDFRRLNEHAIPSEIVGLLPD